MRIMVPIDVFDVAVYFFFGEEEKKAFLRKTGASEFDPMARGYTANNATWIKDDNDMSTVIHEAYHLTQFIKHIRDLEDEESGAYMIEFIVQNVVNKIRKKKGVNG